uniref:VWFA domain-containing protein n=1 Tax=Poecilia formosa TaxID=48698 RepID=A0A087XPQ4_POEFO
VPASLVPYSLSFSAQVSSPRPISKIESSCSLEPLQYLNADQTQATVKLGAGHKFDRDVELLIYYKDAHQPSAMVEAGQASAKPGHKSGSLMGDPVVMVSLYPEFPQSVMSSLTTCGEFIFLVDRSGSMGSGMNHKTSQSRMDSAKETLLFLLKSLPMGCYFNIYSFGTTFEYIFPNSVKYTQKTMENALKKVEEMAADLGGTEILQPLTLIYSQQCIPNHPRQLFVFSDGEVGNTKDVLDLVRKNSDSHRCLSFGIGEGASSALINGMAKEGGGHAQFITGTERMQPKVMESLRFALHPTVVDISLTWDLPKGVSATVLSPPIKALFQGQRSVIYSQLSGKISEASEACVKVKYSLAGHPCENQLHFSLNPSGNTGLTVHRLAARTLIHSLEMKMREPSGMDNDAKRKVVKLSVESGVNSSFTAFIAVNKTTNKVIQGPLVRRNVPTAIHDIEILLHSSMFRIYGEPETAYAACPCSIPGTKKGNNKCVLFFLLENKCDYSKSKSFHNYCVNHSDVFPKISHLKKYKDPPQGQSELHELSKLVSLQKATGCWMLDEDLAAVLGKTKEEVEKAKPGEVKQEVWTTILALIWLHSFKTDKKAEWELLSMKAASWLNDQNASRVPECVAAGNTLLDSSVRKEDLGI